jgi:hypothetical protein
MARDNPAKGPVAIGGFRNCTKGASIMTNAISTTTPTTRSAMYSSNSFQKSSPLFCTSATVAQPESIAIWKTRQKISKMYQIMSSSYLKDHLGNNHLGTTLLMNKKMFDWLQSCDQLEHNR